MMAWMILTAEHDSTSDGYDGNIIAEVAHDCDCTNSVCSMLNSNKHKACARYCHTHLEDNIRDEGLNSCSIW